jgi:hypothetical protein
MEELYPYLAKPLENWRIFPVMLGGVHPNRIVKTDAFRRMTVGVK